MNNHTKGTWKVTHPIQDADAARHIWTQTDPATGHRELVAIIPDAEGDHVSADARLIASAPELLDAAQLVIAAWESGDLAAAVRNLDSVVQKAAGSAQ